MNRRNFFTWTAAAIGWLGFGKVKPTGNCFATFHGPDIDVRSQVTGRYTSFKAAMATNPIAVIEYGPEAWTTSDLSTIGALCLTVPQRTPITTGFLVEQPAVNKEQS